MIEAHCLQVLAYLEVFTFQPFFGKFGLSFARCGRVFVDIALSCCSVSYLERSLLYVALAFFVGSLRFLTELPTCAQCKRGNSVVAVTNYVTYGGVQTAWATALCATRVMM